MTPADPTLAPSVSPSLPVASGRAAAAGSATMADKTAALLAAIWQRNLPLITERVLLLDHAAALAADDRLTAPLRRDAAMAAHKLAGTLGMFGYPDGTRIARDLEQLLDGPDPSPAPHLLRLACELRATLPLSSGS